jgi:hypothetical protein
VHDPVEAVAREVIEQMHAYQRPKWQVCWMLAKRLRQHRLEAQDDVLRRAARAAAEHAEAVGLEYPLDADDLVIDMLARWNKIRVTTENVVLAMAQQARARPGTFHVEVPAPIRLLVDTLWHLSQLGGRGVASPSQRSLAEALGCEQQMISSYLQVAVLLGLIECVDPKFIPGRKAKTWKVRVGPKHTPPKAEEP